MEYEDRVAIIIPTMNRVDFLIRTVQYYASINSPHPIYIGDASNSSSEEIIIKAASNKVKVHYFHWKGLSDRKTCGRLAKEALVVNKFCAQHGDDDFLVPESLSLCADYLERNSNYATAQGKAVVFSLDKSGPYGKISSFGTYWSHRELTGNTARERLSEIANNYWVPNFSVHRTSEFIEDMLGGVNEITDRNFGELNNSFSMAIRGKSKFIDCLYLVRNVHDRIEHPTHYDWISSNLWHPSLLAMIDRLASFLQKIDGISNETSLSFVENSIEIYINTDIDYIDYRLIVKKNLNYLGLFKFFKKVRESIFLLLSVFPINILSLESLKSKSSKYYKSFDPVLKSLERPD